MASNQNRTRARVFAVGRMLLWLVATSLAGFPVYATFRNSRSALLKLAGHDLSSASVSCSEFSPFMVTVKRSGGPAPPNKSGLDLERHAIGCANEGSATESPVLLLCDQSKVGWLLVRMIWIGFAIGCVVYCFDGYKRRLVQYTVMCAITAEHVGQLCTLVWAKSITSGISSVFLTCPVVAVSYERKGTFVSVGIGAHGDGVGAALLAGLSLVLWLALVCCVAAISRYLSQSQKREAAQ